MAALGLDSVKLARISRAYELAEGIKGCIGCGFDDMNGKIPIDVGTGEKYFVQCPVLSSQCRYGEALHDRIDSAVLDHVKAISGVPKRFHDQLIEPQRTAAVRGVNRWSIHLGQKCFLVLFGEHGSGKSFGAAYALCEIDRQRLLVNWDKPYKWSHIKALWTSAYRLATNDEIFEAARSVPVLVIDDLGGEENTVRAKGKIAETISERYNCASLTIITTNEDMQSLERIYGRRMYDRLMDVGDNVYCGGESLRLSA